MSTAEQPSLIDSVADKAVAGIPDVLAGDQRMAGAEGPLQGHPEGLAAAVKNAPGISQALGAGQAAIDALSEGAAMLGGAALSGIHGAAAAVPFLRALLRPLVRKALELFAAELNRLVITPLKAELDSIAANHPDVNLDRARAAVGQFYPAAGVAAPASTPAPAPAPAQPAAPQQSPVLDVAPPAI